jgi:hypothetical protein
MSKLRTPCFKSTNPLRMKSALQAKTTDSIIMAETVGANNHDYFSVIAVLGKTKNLNIRNRKPATRKMAAS